MGNKKVLYCQVSSLVEEDRLEWIETLPATDSWVNRCPVCFKLNKADTATWIDYGSQRYLTHRCQFCGKIFHFKYDVFFRL